MSNWIKVKDKLPSCGCDNDGDYWGESASYPVKVKGFGGWTKGHLVEINGYRKWSVTNFSGDFEVTEWLPIEQPE